MKDEPQNYEPLIIDIEYGGQKVQFRGVSVGDLQRHIEKLVAESGIDPDVTPVMFTCIDHGMYHMTAVSGLSLGDLGAVTALTLMDDAAMANALAQMGMAAQQPPTQNDGEPIVLPHVQAFYDWVARCCELLGWEKERGVEMFPENDPSWHNCYDERMTPEQAVERYRNAHPEGGAR